MTAEPISTGMLPSNSGTNHSDYGLRLVAGKGELAQRLAAAGLNGGSAEHLSLWSQVYGREAGEPRSEQSASQDWPKEETVILSDSVRTRQGSQPSQTGSRRLAPESLESSGEGASTVSSNAVTTLGEMCGAIPGEAIEAPMSNWSVSVDTGSTSPGADLSATSKKARSHALAAPGKDSDRKPKTATERTESSSAPGMSHPPFALVAGVADSSHSSPTSLTENNIHIDALAPELTHIAAAPGQCQGVEELLANGSSADLPVPNRASTGGAQASFTAVNLPSTNHGRSEATTFPEYARGESIGGLTAGPGAGSSGGLATIHAENIGKDPLPERPSGTQQDGLKPGFEGTTSANTVTPLGQLLPSPVLKSDPAVRSSEVAITISNPHSQPVAGGLGDMQSRKYVRTGDANAETQTGITVQVADHRSKAAQVAGSISPALVRAGKTRTAKESTASVSNIPHDAELAGATPGGADRFGPGLVETGNGNIPVDRLVASAAKTVQGDPFVAMDASSAGTVTHPQAEPRDGLRVGYRDAELGYVELSAQQLDGAIHASLHAATDVASATLTSHLGSLTNWLQERQTPVETLRVQAGGQELAGQHRHQEPSAGGSGAGSGQSGGNSFTTGPDGYSGSNVREAHVASVAGDPSAQRGIASDQFWSSDLYGHAGQISVIA